MESDQTLSTSTKAPSESDTGVERAISLARNCLSRSFQCCDAADRPLPPAADGEAAPGPKDRGYWVGELEADTTLESDYIIFLYFLDPVANREKIRKLSNYIRSLKLGKMMKYEYVPAFQSALYAPKPLAALANAH